MTSHRVGDSLWAKPLEAGHKTLCNCSKTERPTWPSTWPLVQRLLGYGRLRCFVAGPWGEISDDFQELLLELAEARVAKEARVSPGGWEEWAGHLCTVQWDNNVVTIIISNIQSMNVQSIFLNKWDPRINFMSTSHLDFNDASLRLIVGPIIVIIVK